MLRKNRDASSPLSPGVRKLTEDGELHRGDHILARATSRPAELPLLRPAHMDGYATGTAGRTRLLVTAFVLGRGGKRHSRPGGHGLLASGMRVSYARPTAVGPVRSRLRAQGGDA